VGIISQPLLLWESEADKMTINKSKKETNIKYNVLEDYAIKDRNGGYTLRLRYMQWNDRDPVYDLRPWKTDDSGKEICGKGITLSGEELEALIELIK
jgi:hypothetical protein